MLIKVGSEVNNNYLSLDKFTDQFIYTKVVEKCWWHWPTKALEMEEFVLKVIVLYGHTKLTDLFHYLHNWDGFYFFSCSQS